MSEALATSAGQQGGSAPSAMWLWSATAAEVVKLAGQLRRAGVAVQCLGGDQKWLAEPDLARQWLARTLTGWKFDAVHLDVEPWAIKPCWTVDRVRLFNQNLALLRAVRQPGLPLEVDVAPRLATDTAGGPRVLDAVLGLAEAVTVMAYRDHAEGADGILEFSRLARVACSERLTGFRIGVETQPAERAGGPRQTFAEEGRVALEREAAVVSSHLGANRSYCGVAVHDWHHWRGLA